MHVIQYPEEDHNHEKARLFLLGDFTSDLSYSDVEENQFWEMVRSYFRKRLDQSEAHECLWDHSPAFCIWHLLCRNGPTNMKDHLTQEQQSVVLQKFREFAYEDDDRFLDQAEQEWQDLMAYVETNRRQLK